MEITMEKIQDVVKTLPITFYTKRDKVKVKCIDKEVSSTSFYDQIENIICINVDQMITAITEHGTPENFESIIRSMFYHELSHAILTPKKLMSSCWAHEKEIMNIFEDERIETIMKKYYFDVNFKRLVQIICNKGQDLMKPASALEMFFNAVRFRVCKNKDLLKKIHDLIVKWKDLDKNTGMYVDRWGDTRYSDSKVSSYKYDVLELFREFKDYFDDMEEEEKLKSSMGSRSSTEGEDEDKPDGMDTKESEGDPDMDNIKAEKEDSEEKDEMPASLMIDDFDPEESDREADDEAHLLDKKVIENKFHDVTGCKERSTMTDEIKMIFQEKKNLDKRNGSAINAYSGVFDVRSVVREDYKYFVQKNRLGHQKMFSKIHLNLFIDESGSFRGSKETVNMLLSSLEDFEQENKDFEFDVITCEMGERVRKKSERRINPWGGNCLDEEIFPIFKRQQKPGYVNYNIVLFDGDAFTDGGKPKNFGAFNTSNTIIISSPSNQSYIEEFSPKSKNIFTRNYKEELIKNVFNTLKVLVR